MNNLIQVGNYFIKNKIGKGSFSNVFKGYHKDDHKREYAIKVIYTKDMTGKLLQNLQNEISVLMKINHPNIIKLHDTFKTKKCIYIVLEYCDDGDLYNYIKTNGKIEEEYCRKLFTQASHGLYYLWINNLIHRDIKPHNFLLSSGVLKIADFGFIKYLEEAKMADTLCGSPIYMAPEILKYGKYDAKVDLWSMGVVLFEMLTGNPPFTAKNHVQLLKKIETTKFEIPEDINLSKTSIDLLECLLIVDPISRISFEKFFIHKFFNKFRFEKDERDSILKEEYEKEKENKDENDTTKTKISSSPLLKFDIIDNYMSPPNTVSNNAFETIIYVKIYVESIHNSVKEVSFFGDIQERNGFIKESFSLHIKALNLYGHAITVCNNTIKSFKEADDILSPILYLLQSKFNVLLEKTNFNFLILTKFNPKAEIVSAEKLIYEHAIELTKEAIELEETKEYIKAVRKYIWALRLFESLTIDEKPLDDHDFKIVDDFIKKINSRISSLKCYIRIDKSV